MEAETQKSYVPQIVVAVLTLVALIAVVILGIMFPEKQYKAQKADYEQQIASLRADLEEAQTAESDAKPEEIQAVVSSAVKAGEDLASLEMDMAAANDRYVHAQTAEEQEKVKSDMADIKDAMYDYLGKESPYASTWYMGDSDLVAYEWEFASYFDFVGKYMPVLWVCRQSDDLDVILAYVMGTYDSVNMTFSDMVTGVTTAGGQYFSVTHPEGTSTETFDPKTYGDAVIALANSIQADTVVPSKPYTEEEASAIADNMSARDELAREGRAQAERGGN